MEPIQNEDIELAELSAHLLETTWEMLEASWLFRFAWRRAMRMVTQKKRRIGIHSLPVKTARN